MVNLEGLPAPTLFYDISYEDELQTLQDEFLKLNPNYENLLLESDPVNKLLEVYAYKNVLFKSEVNEKLKQCMLRYSTGSNLDNIAANSVTMRLPNESDESFRYRASIAPEGFTCAGPTGAYEYHALKVSKDVMHATVLAHTPKAGDVTLVILSHSNKGEASAALCQQVLTHLNDEQVRPLCDTVYVEKARIKDISIIVKATYFEGTDKERANAQILKALEYMSELNNAERKAKDIFKPKEMLTVNQIHQAARVAGIQNIEVISPISDVQPSAKESIRIIKRQVMDGGYYE